ncbi:MAG: DoxX family protein [Phycicoccus sp.]
MTSSTQSGPAVALGSGTRSLLAYRVAMTLFCLVFGYSGVWTLVDPEAARVATEALDYPAWIVVPQGVAKLVGLVAIMSRRSVVLAGLAFAGFFYDVLLALASHVVHADWPGAILATFGLVVTVVAFFLYRDRYLRLEAR